MTNYVYFLTEQDTPGFYLVKNDGRHTDYLIGAARLFLINRRTIDAFTNVFLDTGAINHGYLMGLSIKRLVEHVVGLSQGEDDMVGISTSVYGMGEDHISCKMQAEFNGPAATQKISIVVDSEEKFTVSYDIVVGGRLSFWPSEAREWEHRLRKWPPRYVVDEIIRDHQVPALLELQAHDLASIYSYLNSNMIHL